MKVTMEGKYRTRDGNDVRILCVDAPSETYPVVGLVVDRVETWTLNGKYSASESEREFDLIEVAPPTPLEAAARKVIAARGCAYPGDLSKALDELAEALK